MDSTDSEQGPAAGCCEHDNELYLLGCDAMWCCGRKLTFQITLLLPIGG